MAIRARSKRVNSITRRWVRGSLMFTLAVILIAEALFIYFLITGYYGNVRQQMMAQLNTLSGQLSYSVSATGQAKDLQLRRMVEQFDARDKFELMLVEYDGGIASTSSGVVPKLEHAPQDITQALAALGNTAGENIGTNENGERVMAITVRTPYSSDGIMAMRLVTSLELVDQSIRRLILVSMFFILIVVAASVFSGVFFIRSIVLPLQKVEASASRIAKGDFEIRIQNRNDDEIGSLCRTINNMAHALGQSERMKNDFISSVSHELRTPLTSIKGWTETISNLPDPNDVNFRRGVEIIGGETDRLYDMVEELLDFSRLQNELVLEKEKLDLAAEVEDVVLLNAQRARGLGIDIEFGAPEQPVQVFGDKKRMRQVFVNVLDNAIKYSRDGSKIYVDVSSKGRWAVVEVSDEGQGISPEDLENVKVRFYKGRGAVRGSGIGLAVVDEIVAAHEGRFDIESKPGAGTKVVIRFLLDGAAVVSDAEKDEMTN